MIALNKNERQQKSRSLDVLSRHSFVGKFGAGTRYGAPSDGHHTGAAIILGFKAGFGGSGILLATEREFCHGNLLQFEKVIADLSPARSKACFVGAGSGNGLRIKRGIQRRDVRRGVFAEHALEEVDHGFPPGT